MKRKRHAPEEIIKKLRAAATLLAVGLGLEEVDDSTRSPSEQRSAQAKIVRV